MKYLMITFVMSATFTLCSKPKCDDIAERERNCPSYGAYSYTTLKGFTTTELDTVWVENLDSYNRVVYTAMYSSIDSSYPVHPIRATDSGTHIIQGGLRLAAGYRVRIPATGRLFHISGISYSPVLCKVCGQDVVNKYVFSEYKENGIPKTPTDELGSIMLTK